MRRIRSACCARAASGQARRAAEKRDELAAFISIFPCGDPYHIVMAGLVPAIHALMRRQKKDVDAGSIGERRDAVLRGYGRA